MTLTQVATFTRQIIIISIFALILGTVAFVGFRIWYAYYLANLPPVEEKADTKFGILPYPDFPKTEVSSSNFSYSIDTATGGLPKVGVDGGFEKLVKVYFVNRSFATLLSPEKSQTLAEKLGITTPPQILTETNYLFAIDGKTLNVDLDSGNFIYQQEATISSQVSFEREEKLISDFKRLLGDLGVYREDLSKAPAKVVLLKRDGVEVAQISLWQANLANTPIVTPEFNKALINAEVIQSADKLQDFLAINFSYFPIDTSTFATYPSKSAEIALEDLRSGKGVVIIEPPKPSVSITSVYLGYFLGEIYSPYLQPVFVFEGPQFVAYVPAISEQFQSQAR